MVELFHNTKKKNVRRCIVKYTEQHASLLYYTTCLASGVISHSQYMSKTFTVSAAAAVVVGKKYRSQSEHSEELGKENTPTKFSSTRKKQASSVKKEKHAHDTQLSAVFLGDKIVRYHLELHCNSRILQPRRKNRRPRDVGFVA